MTTKVVKGSIWTLAGSVFPLAISFVATPFVIRFLGAEGYGVLLLVSLIPTYFSFADFGMGVASTKFASEAYGEGNSRKEGELIRAAGLIALISSLLVAVPIFLFSFPIVEALNVPDHLLGQANIALKLAATAFVVGILATVVNSPMLARLRMDLNSITIALPKVLLAAVTPVILYLGGGVVGAVSWTLIVGVLAFIASLSISGRLLPELFRGTINRDLFRPLIKFGGAWCVAMVAAMLLVNLEKLFLTKMVSVKALAYYSVAFTFANMATIFAQAMIQSLIPAFSQLLTPERRAEFDALFARSIRLNLIWLLPAIMTMFVVAKPFFTIWAGPDFGENSTWPFYVLLIGLFFNLQATVPYLAIVTVGRTDIFARVYWIELAVYAIGAFLLISNFGIVGAAAAWTLRVVLDALIMIRLSKKYAEVKFRHVANLKRMLLAGLALVPAAVVSAIGSNQVIIITLALVGLTAYALAIWMTFVDADEKRWIVARVNRIRGQN